MNITGGAAEGCLWKRRRYFATTVITDTWHQEMCHHDLIPRELISTVGCLVRRHKRCNLLIARARYDRAAIRTYVFPQQLPRTQ